MNISFAVDSLKTDQFSFTLLNYCNSLCEKHCPIIFTREIPKLCIPPRFAIMNIIEAFRYDGILIATSFSTLETIQNCLGQITRYLYLWNPEWISEAFNFPYVYSLLHSTKIPVIVRSIYHQQIFKNNFQINALVSDNFNLEALKIV